MARKTQKSSTRPPRRGVAAWLELLRLPNLATVPGDPVCGFLLASGGAQPPSVSLALAVLAAFLLYAAGLILNDVADLEEDRRDRPTRPLPSGRIRFAHARWTGWALLALALISAGLASPVGGGVAAALAACLLLYTFGGIAFRRAGPLLLGSCRALSVGLGVAAAVPSSGALWELGAGAIGLYILLVSLVARAEMVRRPSAWARWMPTAFLLFAMSLLVRNAPVAGESQVRMAGALFLAFMLSTHGALQLRSGAPVPRVIGQWIAALIPIQAALALGAGEGIWSALAGFSLLALYPVNRLLARSFYAS